MTVRVSLGTRDTHHGQARHIDPTRLLHTLLQVIMTRYCAAAHRKPVVTRSTYHGTVLHVLNGGGSWSLWTPKPSASHFSRSTFCSGFVFPLQRKKKESTPEDKSWHKAVEKKK
jgi:hypothetical protein